MNRKNIFLILGLSIPLIMIIIIILSVYIPKFFYFPKYDFLYSQDREYWSDQYYIDHGKIRIDIARRLDGKSNPNSSQLFIYNVKQDKVQAISVEQAKILTLDPNPISPDGYQVKSGSTGTDSIFPLFIANGVNEVGVFLSGKYATHKLNIGSYQNTYWGFHFIGWINDGLPK